MQLRFVIATILLQITVATSLEKIKRTQQSKSVGEAENAAVLVDGQRGERKQKRNTITKKKLTSSCHRECESPRKFIAKFLPILRVVGLLAGCTLCLRGMTN